MTVPYQNAPTAREALRAERYRSRACSVSCRALARLSEGDTDPETLHRARTHLRRLQAYLEFDGACRKAAALGRSVSKLSALRMLQVLARRLKRFDAPKSDRRTVKRRMKAERRNLYRAHSYETIARLVRHHMSACVPPDAGALAERVQTVRAEHAASLRRLIAQAGAAPRRKALHRLRLEIKAIRYQEERLLGAPLALPKLVRQLKRAQAVLGEYEDLVQFRRLARGLDLRATPRIEKAWRRARKRARAVPARLTGLPALLGEPRIRPVPDDAPKP